MAISAHKRAEILIALDKFSQIFNILRADLREAGEFCHDGVNNFRLRTYIRTFFAFVEGTSFAIKQVALTVHEHHPCFSEGELSLLRELTYDLDERGNVRGRPKYPDTAENLKFIAKSVTKVFGLQPDILFDDEGWQCFKELIHLRNRITHPKDAASLKIINSDSIVVGPQAELGGKSDTFLKATSWYIEVLKKLASSMESGIKEKYVED